MNRLPLHKLGDFIEKRGLTVLGHCYKCNKISYRTQQEAKKEAADMRKQGKSNWLSWSNRYGHRVVLRTAAPTQIV